jgi:Cu/Ag efflux protein CusF
MNSRSKTGGLLPRSYLTGAGFASTALLLSLSTVTHAAVINKPPTATPATVTGKEDTKVTITLKGVDPEKKKLTYVVVSPPAHGTVMLSGSNATYTPAANYSNTPATPDSFTFKTNDGLLDSAPATVSVVVTANQLPTATPATATTKEDTKVSITLKGIDPEKQKLTYALVSQPLHGTVTLLGSTATYTPSTDYFNTSASPDSFTFKANDGLHDSAPATVSVVVTAVNDIPTAGNGSATTPQDTAVDITLSGADVEGDLLTYVPASKSKNGGTVLLKSGNIVTFTPKKGYVGADSFTFTVKDNNKGISKAAIVSVKVSAKPQNLNPSADAGADQSVNEQTVVTLDGSSSKDSDGTIASYAWKQTTGTRVTLTGATTAKPTFTAPDVAADTTLTFELTVTDNQGATAKDTVNIVVKAITGPIVQPSPTGKLNDTGITKCGNGVSSGFDCPEADYPGQDAEYGRDTDQATNNDYDGYRGFNYTKISSTGQELPAIATKWACVKDNVTGLIWEVKTDDGGLHDKGWTYSWFEPDNKQNGGSVGTQDAGSCGGTSLCDTHDYVQAVNALGWCGAKDWRMPSKSELSSIVSFDRGVPAIDVDYFVNTPVNWYWTASPSALDANSASAVGFRDGYSGMAVKNDSGHVRLIRGG